MKLLHHIFRNKLQPSLAVLFVLQMCVCVCMRGNLVITQNNHIMLLQPQKIGCVQQKNITKYYGKFETFYMIFRFILTIYNAMRCCCCEMLRCSLYVSLDGYEFARNVKERWNPFRTLS